MTITQERKISQLSLRELSFDAAILWEQIEAAQRDDDAESQVGDIIQRLMETQSATESKIDSIVWVKEMLESELGGWKERRERALLLYNDAIQVREDSIDKIKAMLLHLHSTGLISDRNVGKECEIEIRNNLPSVAELKMDVEDEEFPAQFRRVKYSANNQAILDAYKAGIDVEKYANVTIGKQVRFKRKKSKGK